MRGVPIMFNRVIATCDTTFHEDMKRFRMEQSYDEPYHDD